MIDKNLWREGRRSGWLWLTILLSALGGVVIVLQAYLLSRAVGHVFLGGATRAAIAPTLALLLGVIGLRAILAWGRDTAAHRVGAQIKLDLRDRLCEQLLADGPLRAIRQQTGQQTAVLTEGIEALEAYFAEYLPQLFVAGLIPLTILLVIFPADPLSGLILLLTAPLMPLFMILIGRSAERLTQRQFTELTQMSGHFLDVLQGLATLKQLGQSKRQAGNIARISDRFRRTTMGVLRVAFLSALVLELLATLSVAIIAVAIGLRLLEGNIDFTLGFFILILAPEFYLPLRQLGQRFHAGMSGTAAAARIFAVLGETPPPAGSAPSQAAPSPPAFPAPIRFDGVSVTYPTRQAAALRELSFILEPGRATALAGPSGAGKSTVAALLLRFLEPQAGHIWIGSEDLATLDAAQWRRLIAWVPQAPALFQGSIADNIRLARPSAGMAAVEAAARRARLHETITALPAGYDTPVGERGLRLSGGQAQRLALARAFLKDAPLLILDEPAAHLDPLTETELLAATADLLAGRTALIIAHRPATIAAADQVLWLDQGRVTANNQRKTDGKERGAVSSRPSTVNSRRLAPNPQRAELRNPHSALRIQNALPLACPELAEGSLPRRARRGELAEGRALLAFLKPFRARIALSVLLGALTIGSSVALLATSAYLISAAALQPSIADLSVAIVGVRAFGLSRGILRYLERLLAHDVTFRVLAEIRVWFYRALEPLAPARLQGQSSGELLGHIIRDVETLRDFYVRAVYPLFVALLAGAGVLLFFGAFSPQLALAMALFLLLYALALPWLVGALSRSYAATLAETRLALQARLVEGIQGLADLIAFDRAGDWQTAVHEQGARLAAIQRRAATIAGLRSGLGELLTYGAMWAVLWLAIPLASAGRLDAVYLAALALAAVASFELVQPLPGAAQVLAESLAAAQRLFAVVDVEGGTPASVRGLREAPLPPAAPPLLAVHDLRFRYDERGPWVLDGLTFELPPGGTLALYGRSGAGKTTLVNLLLRFWEYAHGEIRLDGRPLRDINPDLVRACFGVVEQRPYLFNTSLYDNLRIARPEATREEIETAARRAQLHGFIAGLPDGYETQAGSLGMALSGGERRRVAIARALLRQAPILLLDEPTAHLDPATAQAVMETLLDLAAEGRSLLLITHDEQLLEKVDQVVALAGLPPTSAPEGTG